MFKSLAMSGPIIGAGVGFLSGGNSETSSTTVSMMGRFQGAVLGGAIGMAPMVAGGMFMAARDRNYYKAARKAGLSRSIAREYAYSSVNAPMWRQVKAVGQEIIPKAVRGSIGLAKGAAKMSLGVTKTVLKHPRAAMAAGLLGLGISALAGSGPQTSNLSDQQRGSLATKMGGTFALSSSLSMGTDTFQQSAAGLTLGLHTARHS